MGIVSIIPYPLNEHVALPPSESMCSDGEMAGVGSSPRPVDYSTGVGMRTKNGAPHARTSCAIHQSAWNRNSANFAGTEFSEVRLPQHPPPINKDSLFELAKKGTFE